MHQYVPLHDDRLVEFEQASVLVADAEAQIRPLGCDDFLFVTLGTGSV
jgi:hypothetical protein